MDEPQETQSLRTGQPAQFPRSDTAGGWKRKLGPIGSAFAVIAGFFGKLKFVIAPLLKFFPVLLKTGGTMILSIGLYASQWGWLFAVGFVFLIFVHECGHLIAARWFGLKVGAPVFIPFMGAFIALKEAPRNAWVEAWVGIGGPLLGTVGAGVCVVLDIVTGNRLFAALAYTGFWLNLFNLAPVGFLDGGRIATALSPWMWIVGLVLVATQLFYSPNVMLVLIIVLSLPRLLSLFRARTDAERRYFEVSPHQRGTMAALYFGLVAVLVFGMHVMHVEITPH